MSDHREHPLLGMTLADRYLLKRVLGSGGMGAVFVALDEETGGELALKLLRDASQASEPLPADLEKRLEREVHLLSALTKEAPEANDRIIKLYDWGRAEGVGLFYTMEWIREGQTVLSYLDSHVPGIDARLSLLCEILLGLDILHQHRIVHRDLKPSNILCWSGPAGPQIKLIDLGIARWFSDVVKTHMTVETAPGSMLGSPAYMAPEMWRNEAVDARTDVYQMGILAYQVLAGSLPFSGTPHQLMFQHLHGFLPALAPILEEREPTFATEVLVAIDSLLQRCTHLNPDERPANARDMLDAFEGFGIRRVRDVPTGEFLHPPRTASAVSIEFSAPDVPTHSDEEDLGLLKEVTSASQGSVEAGEASGKRRMPLWLWGVVLGGCAAGLWWFFVPHPVVEPAGPRAQVRGPSQQRAIRRRSSVRRASVRRASVRRAALVPGRKRVVPKVPVSRRRRRPVVSRKAKGRTGVPGLRKPGLEDTLLLP